MKRRCLLLLLVLGLTIGQVEAQPPGGQRPKAKPQRVDEGSLVVLFDQTGQSSFVANGAEAVLEQCWVPALGILALLLMLAQQKALSR